MFRSKRTRAIVFNRTVESSPIEHVASHEEMINGRAESDREKNASTADSSPNSEGEFNDSGYDDYVDDMEHDVSSNGSNKSWSNLSFDDDELIQIIDANSNIRERKGLTPPSFVWCLEAGDKIIVKFNEYKQPIGKGGKVLVRFLGDIAKTGELVPIGAANWHKVDNFYKIEFVKLIHEKFVLPENSDVTDKLVRHVGEIWRGYRYELKKKHFEPHKTQQQNASKVVPDVIPQQWVQLVSHWYSPIGKKLSEIGKRSRADKSHHHTTGATSYAQKRHEFKKKNKRDTSNLEFLMLTHKKADGSYVKNTQTQELVDNAKGEVAQRTEKSPEKSRTEVENIVFDELMYDNENPNQRPIGFGHGVTRSEVFGLKGQLRKMSEGGFNDSIRREEFDAMKKKNVELEKLCMNMASTISEFRSVFQRMGVNIDGQKSASSARSDDERSDVRNQNGICISNSEILRNRSNGQMNQAGGSRRSRNTT